MSDFAERELPGHGQRMLRLVLIGVPVTALSMAGCLAADHFGLRVLAGLFAGIFLLTGLFVLLRATLLVKRVSCPECGRQLRGEPDRPRNLWVAECPDCRVRWLLGVGTRSASF